MKFKKLQERLLIPSLIVALGFGAYATIKPKKQEEPRQIVSISAGVTENNYIKGLSKKFSFTAYKDYMETGFSISIPYNTEDNNVQPMTIIITPTEKPTLVAGIELEQSIGSFVSEQDKFSSMNVYISFPMTVGASLTEYMQKENILLTLGVGLEGRLYVGNFYGGIRIEKKVLINPDKMRTTLEEGIDYGYEMTLSGGISF